MTHTWYTHRVGWLMRALIGATAVATLASVLALAGCATGPPTTGEQQDSPSVYDRIKSSQRMYCTETSPVTRAVLLTAIRSQVPLYPASGLCTGVEQALAEELARQLENLPEGTVIDLERAIEDQRRFELEP